MATTIQIKKSNKKTISKPKTNQLYQPMHKFHSRISFGSNATGRIRLIEGVRAFMALIVIFHHVDLINPRINRVSNIIWSVNPRPSRVIRNPELHQMDDNINIIFGDHESNRGSRQLLSNKGRPSGGKLTAFGIFASAFDITFFCLITGYVMAMVGFRYYDYDFEFENAALYKNLVLCTSNYPFWFYKFIRLLIRRSLKMLYSLAIVQFVTYLLFIYNIIKLRNTEEQRAWIYYNNFYEKHLNMDSLFWSEINGALWVCETFFWSTFASFIVLSITINIKYIKYRMLIYILMCIMYNGSYYLPIFMGILIADIDHHGYYQIYFTSLKKVHNLLCISVLLIFIKIPYFDTYLSQYLIWRCIASSNLSLYCLQYPKFWLSRFFSHDYLCYWGQYTFPLYIWHMIIYRFIGTNITPFFVDKNEKVTQLLWIDYGLILFGAFCAIIFAIFFNKCIEKPWNNHVVKPILAAFQAAQNEQDKIS